MFAGSTFLGIDAGSVSVKCAVIDADGNISLSLYRRHGGRPLETAREILAGLDPEALRLPAACTGSSGKTLSRLLGVPYVNELAALGRACAALAPDAACVIEMGGEDAKFVLLDQGRVADFALNSVCAAGTGSFLDQQAERMGLSIEDFAALSLESEHPPHIASRCSVFAKSDMIHLQQIATPLADIAAGLCFAVARNVKGSVVRGRPVPLPALFVGGVALNAGVARAMREVFGLPVTVPENATLFPAAGAALRAAETGEARPLDAAGLTASRGRAERPQAGLTPLRTPGDRFTERHVRPEDPVEDPVPGEPLYLGIDIGSISTNLAVVGKSGRVVAKRYLRTASKPIEAVRRGLAEIADELSARGVSLDVAGVGTTGSGRYMIADFVGADIVKNEITAQARGAAAFVPDVDTIFEIGGQDSKYISLRDGTIVDFEMNKACAAGTGSFLEEQAEKLGIAIKGEFADMALSAASPRRLGERCTVFMENSLQQALAGGGERGDLLAGLAYSIVENYLGRVVLGRAVGENVLFQGGTAFNKAVVAAFEKRLGRPVVVPPHHDVTGAIGMALIARDHMQARKNPESSTFKGWDLARIPYSLMSFQCAECDNRCEINRVTLEGRPEKLFYGGRCEKYDIRRKPGKGEDLFQFRDHALRAAHEERARAHAASGRAAPRGKIGLPMVFFLHERLPFLSAVLWELGYEPVLSPATSRRVVAGGVEAALADTCFPVKAALGHVRALADAGLARLFIPSFVDLAEPGGSRDEIEGAAQACPLTQSFPYQARASFADLDIVAPTLSFPLGDKALAGEIAESLGVSEAEALRAVRAGHAAQAEFSRRIQDKGRSVLANLTGRALVLVGRPYNAFDAGMNLGIPSKLASLEETAIPMDFLPLDPDAPEHARMSGQRGDPMPEMYWRSGRRILAAARLLKKDPRLFPVYIGNFSCGPDSFILHFFADAMRPDASGNGDSPQAKPWLHVEIDEHSADAGAVTRLEAFLDSIGGTIAASAPTAHSPGARTASEVRGHAPRAGRGSWITRRRGAVGRTVLVPPMCDHSRALAAAFRHCGLEARVMDDADADSLALAYRHLSGKECYPCAVTTAHMLKAAQAPDFDPAHTAFFMPGGSGPCRFGLYNVLQRRVLDAAGLEAAALFSPVQGRRLYHELGIVGRRFSRRAWEGIVAFDLLTKCLHQYRPGEAEPGSADALYEKFAARLEHGLSNGGCDLPVLAREAAEAFQALPRDDSPRPLVGVVGEIFVRSSRFSNEDLVRRIEALGGRAWLAPMDEWILYVGFIARRRAKLDRDLRGLLKLWLEQRTQARIAHAQEHAAAPHLPTVPEPDTERVLEFAAPYLRDTFEGEAVLTVGKSVDMIKRGARGIVNAIPFGCMPGTVAQAMLRRVSEEHGVPAITLPFDGTPQPASALALETFMEQCRRV
ncbi:CoA-substrate-specific enzyme activase [Desulfovibrio sp. X2]|uniref:acyl-CoA dehydratase activase n=1 Tax=Desulfovibrio sp. X2 TaxID=941449 RepID=UPI0003588F35|nr:acyl-CoA dehydratase activase [Desulfovibrio sp. X2]EPR39783.1 CoA-substrate-specific enzyme activase [Desulfovibrio sp. X2]